MIFETISVKARWERWCRWNCDLRVINARKKAFSVVPKASPWCPNHVTICLLRHSGESLQNGQLELRRRNWYFVRETHKDTAVSVWACQTARCDKWWDAECRGVLMCDVECYVKHVWASALCTFYNNPAPLNGSMQFHYCTLVTREPEQTTLLFWSAACGVTPHGLHTADRR